jgi:DNA-binding NarL/FixJ family response regulator
MSQTTSHLDNVRIRIGILAAHPVVVAGLKQMLTDANLIVTHEASTVDEAVSMMSNDHPDVAIVDPDSNDVTLHAVTQLNEAGLEHVLVFTSVTDHKVHQLAFELGALGVVIKDQPADTLIRAVRKIHAGEAWLERVQTANLLNAIRRRRDPEEAKIESLTKREREVIKMVTLGLNGAAIGERLFISEATVRNHLTSILGKLELANRFELAVYAFRHRLVDLHSSEAINARAADDARESRAGARRAVGI